MPARGHDTYVHGDEAVALTMKNSSSQDSLALNSSQQRGPPCRGRWQWSRPRGRNARGQLPR